MRAGGGAQRMFLALWPPRELQRELAGIVAPHVPAAMRACRASELHVTLLFLGDVAPELAAEIDRALAPIAAGCPRPELALRGTGAFPARGRERILWAGVDGEPPAHRSLRRELAEACARLGFAREEREGPLHVTVARAGRERRRVEVPASFYELDFRLSWQPDGVGRVVSRPGAAESERFEVAALHPFG